jgi:hypothetical protein
MTDTPPYGDATQPLPPVQPAEVPARGRRGLLIGAGAATLALVAGAAVWATTTLSGGGRQPDEVVPKSTFAYVKIDLDPAANQKLAARSYFGKFPELKDDAGNDDVFENVLDDVVSNEYLDYGDDVKPWFDKRAAVAAFPAGGDHGPNVVAVLRSKDDAEARVALDRAAAKAKADGGDVAYRLTKGYALVGSTVAVDQAVRQAEDGSLRDNEVYRDDVDRLDGDQVAVAWADLAATFDAVRGGIPFGDLLPGIITEQVKGRLVAGLHLTGDYAEVQGLSIGLDPETRTKGGDHTLLAGLPKDTAVAVSGTGLGEALAGENGSLLELLLGQYLVGSDLSLTDDLVPLLGDELVVAAEPPSEGGLLGLRLGVLSNAEVGDDGFKTAVLKVGAIMEILGLPVRADWDNGKFVLAMPMDYTDELSEGPGGLGDEDRYRRAVGDVKGASLVAYADLRAVRTAFPAFAGGPGDGLVSAGLVTGFRDKDAYFRLRLVAE